jgi:hypothetical protein
VILDDRDRPRSKQRDIYDPSALSPQETERFLAALGDGFGVAHRNQHLEEARLPRAVEPGLLRHRAYYYKNRRSECWDGDEEEEFWEESDGDSPPGLFQQCPINFHLPAIRKYFEEQMAAYLTYAKSSDDYSWFDQLSYEEQSNWEAHIYDQVLYNTYSKAWYEYHINQHLYFFDESDLTTYPPVVGWEQTHFENQQSVSQSTDGEDSSELLGRGDRAAVPPTQEHGAQLAQTRAHAHR